MCPTTHTIFQCKPREVISHFNTLFSTTCCNSKVSECLWSLKNVFACLNTSFQLLLLTTNKYIILIIWFYIFFSRHPMVFFIFQCKPREVISHFNTLFSTTCCNSKVSECLWSLKNVFACLNTSFQLLLLTTNKYIILIIWFYIFFSRHPMVFFISEYKAVFKLRGFDFINYIYI